MTYVRVGRLYFGLSGPRICARTRANYRFGQVSTTMGAMGVTVPFLMYHRVAPTPPSSNVPGHYVHPGRFKAHMAALKRKGYAVTSLDDVAARWQAGRQADPKSLVITLDDGYEHWDHHAIPNLRQHRYPATLFIVAGRMGGTNTWDNQHGDVVEMIADEDMVLRWATEGFTIGSHGMSHQALDKLAADHLKQELEESMAKLGGLLKHPVPWLCYPHGGQGESVRAAAKAAGYLGACSTRKGLNDEETDPFQWRRINVRADTWTPVLFWKIKREERRHKGGP